MQDGQHPFPGYPHPPQPHSNGTFSLPAMMGIPHDLPQSISSHHHSLPSPSTSSHTHLHPPPQYQLAGTALNMAAVPMSASSSAGPSGSGGGFSPFPLDLAGQANGWLEGHLQGQGNKDDEMGGPVSSSQGGMSAAPTTMGMPGPSSRSTSLHQSLSPTISQQPHHSPLSHHSFTHSPQHQNGPGFGSGSGSGAYPSMGAMRSPSSSSQHQQQQQYGMQPELQPQPNGHGQHIHHQMGVNGNSPLTPPYPNMRMPVPQYDYTHSFQQQQQQQPEPGSSAQAQLQNPPQPPSAAPSLPNFQFNNKHQSRPGSTSSATASLNGTASRGSDRGSVSTASALPENVPRVGGVRCYWALLKPRYPFPQLPNPHISSMAGTPVSAYAQGLGEYSDLDDKGHLSAALGGKKFELDFIHLDPVLAAHMRTQSLSMMGRGVIEFIHPDEREQARKDLYSAISINNLEGSVTRVRFARLSRIRTILGCPPEDEDIPEDAHTFVEDDEYLVLDLSIHWACDGLLLAFFHAIKDKDKQMNNDPTKRNEEWSNYCGTAHFEDQDIENIWTDVERALPLSDLETPSPPAERVFIIHSTEESATRPDSVIFAWPPPRMKHQIEANSNDSNMDSPDAVDAQGRRNSDVKPRMDGKYWAEDYAELMKHVELENKGHFDNAWGAFGQTSCQKRFQGGHLMTNEGFSRKIESVFIPYGRITFACFQTTQSMAGVPPLPSAAQASQPLAGNADTTAGWFTRQSLPPIDTGQVARAALLESDDVAFQPDEVSPGMHGLAPGENSAHPPLSPVPSAVNRLREITPAVSAIDNNGYPAGQSRHYASHSYGVVDPNIDPSLSLHAGVPVPEHPTSLSHSYHPHPQTMAFTDAEMHQSMHGIPVAASQPYHPIPALPPHAPYSVQHPQLNGMQATTAQPVMLQTGFYAANGQPYWEERAGRPSHPHPHPHSQLITYQADPRGMKRKVEHGMDIPPPLNAREAVYPQQAAMAYGGRVVVSAGPGDMGVPLRVSAAMPPHHASRPFAGIPVHSGSHMVTQPLLMRNGNELVQEPEKKKKREDREARAPVPPPDGIDSCQHCGITESPEWRKNEDGTKNLCNACGLKLARLQAKRDGRQKPRKKKSDPVNPPAPVSFGQMAAFQTEAMPLATGTTAS